MPFSSLNAINSSKGMQGTSRDTSANFNQAAAQPLQGPPQGMGGPAGSLASPTGSSYTRGAGMMTGYNPRSIGGVQSNPNAIQGAQRDLTEANGVNPGGTVPMADIGGQLPQMTPEEMQDPANAAMAGYQFAATQDQRPSASSVPQQNQMAPRASPQGGVQQFNGQAAGAPAAQATTPAANNPISAALRPKVPMPILNKQVM